MLPERLKKWSGREDLNLRHPAPKAGALPGCATPRKEMKYCSKYLVILPNINKISNIFSLTQIPI